MTNKDILITAGILAGILLMGKLFNDSKTSSNQPSGVLNFMGDKDVPSHLKPPNQLYNGEPIIVTERHEALNFYGSKMY